MPVDGVLRCVALPVGCLQPPEVCEPGVRQVKAIFADLRLSVPYEVNDHQEIVTVRSEQGEIPWHIDVDVGSFSPVLQ
jgi:hypothetical protein